MCGLSGIPVSGMKRGEIPAPNVSPPESDLWKWSREAMHWVQTPKGIKCQICPNNCTMKEDEEGDCRTRVNKEGKLYSIAYGNPCAVHVDPIEKKPLFHFLPSTGAFSLATAGCNLACLNCQNWEISQAHPRNTRNYDLFPEKVIESCLEHNCRSIAYTYSDPVAFYEYTYDTARLAHEQGIKNVLVSAGYIHEKPLRDLCRYTDGANIDLKSFSNEIYEMLNAGTLKPVLESLRIFREEGVWLEITNLIVPDWTDDMEMIKKMCGWLAENGFDETPLHFSRFHPQYKLAHLNRTPVKVLENARNTAISEGLKYVYIGNVPGAGYEDTVCPGCKEIVIQRKGFRVLKMNVSHGKCGHCGTPISGKWS